MHVSNQLTVKVVESPDVFTFLTFDIDMIPHFLLIAEYTAHTALILRGSFKPNHCVWE